MDIFDLTSKIKALDLKVRPAVPLEKIKGLEARLGIKLPEDYVLFVTRIGDGWDKQVVSRTLWKEMKSIFSYEEPDLLCRPFPYTDTWIWENKETNPLPGETDEEWNKRVTELLRPTHFGNIPLIRGANGKNCHLILHGKCAGEIWIFTDIGIAPYSPPVTFSGWISAWLAGKKEFY